MCVLMDECVDGWTNVMYVMSCHVMSNITVNAMECGQVLVCTGMHWYALVCTGMHWYVLVCTGMYWYVLGCKGMQWHVSVCNAMVCTDSNGV